MKKSNKDKSLTLLHFRFQDELFNYEVVNYDYEKALFVVKAESKPASSILNMPSSYVIMDYDKIMTKLDEMKDYVRSANDYYLAEMNALRRKENGSI